MYNNYPPGGFGRPPPSYGGFPGAPVAGSPGLGPPPGTTGAAPGVAPPPGINVAQTPGSLPNRPGGLPSNFQPPANMPNINFNAP
ncbi:hypothetical protein LTS18_014381, partial [Coniosporium uncinatum]